MKKLILILLFVLSAPLVAQSAWIGEDGKMIADTESMRSIGNFGVKLVLTPDENQFRKIWNATGSMPKLRPQTLYDGGIIIGSCAHFHRLHSKQRWLLDVVRSTSSKALTGRKLPPVKALYGLAHRCARGLLELGVTTMKAGFDSQDPLGNYKVIANVKDKISGHTLQLTTGFKVTE